MCELLIRVVDKAHDESTPAAHRSVRGDVIAAAPDGHAWSVPEQINPDWRIVRVPGVTEAEGWSFAAGEPAGRSVAARGRPDKIPHKRMFRLDLDRLVLPADPFPSLDAAAVRAARVAKPPALVRG